MLILWLPDTLSTDLNCAATFISLKMQADWLLLSAIVLPAPWLHKHGVKPPNLALQ